MWSSAVSTFEHRAVKFCSHSLKFILGNDIHSARLNVRKFLSIECQAPPGFPFPSTTWSILSRKNGNNNVSELLLSGIFYQVIHVTSSYQISPLYLYDIYILTYLITSSQRQRLDDVSCQTGEYKKRFRIKQKNYTTSDITFTEKKIVCRIREKMIILCTYLNYKWRGSCEWNSNNFWMNQQY